MENENRHWATFVRNAIGHDSAPRCLRLARQVVTVVK